MATRGVSTVVTYRAWDTSANTPKTGDASNHTLKWVKDGTAASPSNSPSEVDSTNAPGIYKLTLTATETDCTFGVLAGKSSTSNIAIFGVQIGFEYVPTSATTFGAFIGNATAALGVDASGRVDVGKVSGTSQTAGDLGAGVAAIKTQTDKLTFTASTLVQVDVTDWKGSTAPAMTGDAYARIGSAGAGLTNIVLPSGGLANVTAWTVDLTGDITGNLSGSVGSVTGAVGSVTTVSDKTGYALTSTYDFAKGTVAMSESYASLHSAPTPVQAMFGLLARMNEFSVSGTTGTAKKIDGSTTAETFTLDDATNPTSITRAS